MNILDKPDQFIPEHIAHAADQLREWMMKNNVQEIHGLTFAGPGLPIPCIQVTSDERRVTSDEAVQTLAQSAAMEGTLEHWAENLNALRAKYELLASVLNEKNGLQNLLTAVAGMEMFNQHPEPGLGHLDKNGLRIPDHDLFCAEGAKLDIYYDDRDRCTVVRVRKPSKEGTQP